MGASLLWHSLADVSMSLFGAVTLPSHKACPQPPPPAGCEHMHVQRLRQGAGPESSLMAVQGRLSESTEALLSLEKAQRLAEDVGGTRRACAAVLDVLRAAADWKGLNEHILLLAKRRSQLKQVRTDRVFRVSHLALVRGVQSCCAVAHVPECTTIVPQSE